jgi:putative ABC transport system permease protein
MATLNTISWRGLSRRKGRYAMTAIGTALGVAVLFGVLVATNATSASLDKSIREQAGKSDVFVGAVGSYDAVLPDGLPAQVAAMDGVAVAVPSVVLRSSIQVGDAAQAVTPVTRGAPRRDLPDLRSSIVFVNGVDFGASAQLRSFALDSGRLPAPGAPEVVLPHSVADFLKVDIGGVTHLTVPAGSRPVTVVGVLSDDAAGLSAGAQSIWTSVEEARAQLGRPTAYTSVDLALAPGVDRAQWIEAHRAALGDNVAVTNASDAGGQFKQFVASVNGALTLICFIALFVGAFLIFLTFSLAVAERTKVWGTLRALGATPRQVKRVVLVESALLAVLSTALGLLLGMLVAKAVIGLISGLLGIHVGALGLPVRQAVISSILAMLVSLAAAWIPARRAAALGPVTAMREGLADAPRAARPWTGGALLGVGVVLGFSPLPPALRGFTALLVLMGAVLIVPWLLRPVAQVLGAATRRLAPGVGPIAVLHLVKERSRSAYTLALVMVVLSMILAVGTSNVSIRRTVEEVVTRQGGGDITVFAPGAFEPSVGDELRAMDGVKVVSPMRFGQTEVSVDGKPAIQNQVAVMDPATYFRMSSFSYVNGTDARAEAALSKGGQELLPEGTATRLGVSVGDTVRIRTAEGVQPFTLAATYAMVGNGYGVIAGVADVAKFGNGRPNGFFIEAKDGTNVEALRHQIFTKFRPRYDINVETPAVVLAQARAQLRGFFSLGYAILLIAAVIGFLGLANTLVVSVLGRTREIGVLRSTGVLRRQVRRMVLVEAITLAAVAFVLALPLGWLLSAGIISGQRAQLGFSIGFVFPWGLVLPLALMAFVLAAIASLVPAGRASRLQVVAALRFD